MIFEITFSNIKISKVYHLIYSPVNLDDFLHLMMIFTYKYKLDKMCINQIIECNIVK